MKTIKSLALGAVALLFSSVVFAKQAPSPIVAQDVPIITVRKVLDKKGHEVKFNPNLISVTLCCGNAGGVYLLTGTLDAPVTEELEYYIDVTYLHDTVLKTTVSLYYFDFLPNTKVNALQVPLSRDWTNVSVFSWVLDFVA